MEFPTILGFIIIFIVWFAYQRRKNSINNNNEKKLFWDQESQANSIRRKSLDELDFITINPTDFPLVDNEDEVLTECINKIKHLSGEKIVDSTGMTNTELKLKYGSPNLPLLTVYEENYVQLVRTLNRWGKRLFELGSYNEAISVLEYGVKIKSDISETYKILKKIYIKNGSPEKVDFLKEAAESLNSINKRVILEMLNSPE